MPSSCSLPLALSICANVHDLSLAMIMDLCCIPQFPASLLCSKIPSSVAEPNQGNSSSYFWNTGPTVAASSTVFVLLRLSCCHFFSQQSPSELNIQSGDLHFLLLQASGAQLPDSGNFMLMVVGGHIAISIFRLICTAGITTSAAVSLPFYSIPQFFIIRKS